MKLIWTQNSNYYYHSSALGEALVEEISPNKWRWEAYSCNPIQMFDLDRWWGIATSMEEAQLSAERELFHWSI
jgi:hypothetical protein